MGVDLPATKPRHIPTMSRPARRVGAVRPGGPNPHGAAVKWPAWLLLAPGGLAYLIALYAMLSTILPDLTGTLTAHGRRSHVCRHPDCGWTP